MRCKDTTLFSNNKEFFKKSIAIITELRYFILNLTACLSPCDVFFFHPNYIALDCKDSANFPIFRTNI